MHFVIFGLTLSSSWGNGRATLRRGLLQALAGRGHTAAFSERDVIDYEENRDGWVPPYGSRIWLYASLQDVRRDAVRDLRDADVAIVTSYCPDGRRDLPSDLGSHQSSRRHLPRTAPRLAAARAAR